MRRNAFASWAVIVVAVWVSSMGSFAARAQVPRSVSGGSLQFYIGQGVRSVPVPDPSFGGAALTPYAFVLTNNNGQTLTVPTGRFTHDDHGAVDARLSDYSFVFQLYTNVNLAFPRANAQFSAGGRTGADTYVWCPGQTYFGGSGNFVCSLTPTALSVTVPDCSISPSGQYDCPGSGTLMLNIGADLGWARYSRTAHQLGGPARGTMDGSFNVAFNFAHQTVGPAYVTFAGGAAVPTPAIGGAFGTGAFAQLGQSPLLGISVSTFSPGGRLTGNVTQTGITGQCLFLGLSGDDCVDHVLASFGVPFTGGMLTVYAPNSGPMFVLTGSDTRNANGSGQVTLVGGGVSKRTFLRETAQRAILRFNVPEPAPAAGAAAALIALAVVRRLTRRNP